MRPPAPRRHGNRCRHILSKTWAPLASTRIHRRIMGRRWGGGNTRRPYFPSSESSSSTRCVALARSEGEDPPVIRGAPGHGGISKIGLRHIARSIEQPEDATADLKRNLRSLINTEAFPELDHICDMAWHMQRASRRAQGGSSLLICARSRACYSRDWLGSTVV